MKEQIDGMEKYIVKLYIDCKEEIFKDEQVGIIVAKSLGLACSVVGWVAGGVTIFEVGSTETAGITDITGAVGTIGVVGGIVWG